MLNIVITPLPKDKRGMFNYYSNGVSVNGIFDEKADVSGGIFFTPGAEKPGITLYDKDAIAQLLGSSFEELSRFVSSCSFYRQQGDWHYRVYINLSSDATIIDTTKSVVVSVETSSNDWTKPYSIRQLTHKMKELSEQYLNSTAIFFNRMEIISPSFGGEIKITDFNQQIESVVDIATAYTHDLVKNATSQLMAEVENDVVTTFFQFPPEIKTAAKQYLVYFAQFLLDIGIDADTEIREELHETLFKIIPKDKGESLERIKEALELFLNMPGMPNMDAEIAKSGDIAALQLQANIHHLKGQMMLMQAAVQMKDATIESLQLTNYQLKELVEKKDADSKRSEDVIPGIVSVSKFEKGGLSISWAELLRRLKRRF